MAELFDSLASRTRLRTTFAQYSIAFCSQLEATSDVISSANVGQVGMDALVKIGDSRSNRSRDKRESHFAMNDDDNVDTSVRRSSHKGKTPYA